MARIINRVCDGVFNYFGFGAHKGAGRLQFFLLFLNVIFSVWPLVCYVVYSKDIHVVYWLGKVPQYVNLSVPICLLSMNIGVNYFQCFHVRPQAARKGCIMLFVVLGTVLICMGAYVTMQAEKVSTDLVQNCGSDPLSAALQETWTSCKDFYLKCDPTFTQNMEACPGFADQQFQQPPPTAAELAAEEADAEGGETPSPGVFRVSKTYYSYLVDTEFEFDCTGFCEFYAQPIWNKLSEGEHRCASEIARRVGAVSVTVGLPTAGLGVALFLVGVMLAGYDHL
ncbi:unnamed protein product [Amoebophrya sp. A120]|nr:unnamed protein product [Amoebophrya sp. A120]|eukprot:GSA120T00000059001.1